MKILILILLIFLIGCSKEFVPKEDILLKTEDNQEIRSAVWYSSGNKAVILVHMLDRNHSDWRYFAKKLNVFGITAIGIDLRGHGESTGDWKEFNDIQFNDMVYDIKAAKKKLEKQGKDVIGIVGASIGANLALKYAADDKDIKSIVLMSPGIGYKGVNIEEDIKNYNRPLLIIASEEDKYPSQSANILYKNAKGEKDIFISRNLGHGTDMLKSEDIQNRIIEFLSTTLK